MSMNKLENIGCYVVAIGALCFGSGIGGMMYASSIDHEMVSMPIKGCWTQLEGSKRSVSEAFYCRFKDERDNANIDIRYHPLAYKEMSNATIGTHFFVKTEAKAQKSILNKSVPTFLIGGLIIIGGLVCGMVGAATNKRSSQK